MKPKNTFRHHLILAGSISLLATAASYAQANLTWDITPGTVGAGDSAITGGAGTWNTTNGNWTSDAGANNIAWVNANNDTAIFGSTAGNVTLGTGITVGGLTFDTAGYTLTGNTLTFGTAGNITANANATINSNLAGAAISKNGSGTLVLSGTNTYTTTTINAGTLQIGDAGTTGSLGSGTVLNNASLSFRRSSQITVGNVISGSGSVTNLGGTLEITGNNTYGGGTFVNSGTLLLRGDTGGRVGSGAVTVAGTGGANFLIWAPSALTLTNNIVLNGATGNADRPALNHDGGAGKVTLSGTVTLNATSDIGIGGNSSNDMDITGVVSGVGGIIVDERAQAGGNRTLTLAGANTYTGPTRVTGGTLKAGIASVANVSGAFGINSAVTLDNTAGVTLNITGFNTQIGSLTGGGTTGGNVTLGAATLTVGGDNTSPAAYAGVISGTGGVTKIGTGTQILSGTNTYTGQTNVSEGALTFAGSSTGTLGAISVGGTGTSTLNIQAGNYVQGAGGFYVGVTGTGVLNQTGGAVSWNNNGFQLLIGNGVAGTYNLSGGSLTTLTGLSSRGIMLGVNSNGTATFNLSGTGSLTVAGNSRLMIGRSDATQTNTTNLFSQTGGTATISDMTMGGSSGGAGSGNSATLTLTGGTFTAAAFSLLSAANNDVSTINIEGTATVTLPNLPTARGSGATATINFDGGTLRNSATGTFITGLTNAFIKAGGATFDTSLNSTTISQNLLTHGTSLGGGLTKIGNNTLNLTGNNTYTGATTVSGGTLNINGSISGSSAVTVNPAGTLGGAGTINGATTVANGGKLSPGDTGAVGTLNFASTLSVSAVNTASSFAFQLGSTASSDKVNLTSGALTIGTGVIGFSEFAFTTVSGFGTGTYTLFDTTTNISGSLDPADLTGIVGGLPATLSLANSNSDIVLTVVPEPSSLALLGLGVFGLMRRRRS